MKNKPSVINAIGFGGLAAAAIGAFVLSTHAALALEKEPPKNATSRTSEKVRQADLIGKPAPALSIEKLLQAPDGAAVSWTSLKGKCVVLEFWATWCAPCVGSIPHMNELRTHFKSRPIEFIAVTDEPEAKISAFLKRRPIESWIGLDTNGSLFDDYGIRVIPQTVLVDAKGVTVAITSPEKVTTDVIESLLHGRPLILPMAEDESEKGLKAGSDPSDGGANEALYQIVIRPATNSEGGRSASRAGKLSIMGCDPAIVLSSLYGTPVYQIDIKADLPKGPFDVIASIPNGGEDQLYPALRRAVEMSFRIKTRRENHVTEVFVLGKIKNGPPKIKTTVMSDDGGSFSNVSAKRIEMTNKPLEALVHGLGSQLKNR